MAPSSPSSRPGFYWLASQAAPAVPASPPSEGIEPPQAAGVESVRAFLARSTAAEAAAIEARRVALRRLADPAAVLLRACGARRVWVVGSLAWGGLHARSDLDLAVEGLPPERWSEAREALWDLAGEPVDLIPLEAAAATLRARVLDAGREVGLEPPAGDGAAGARGLPDAPAPSRPAGLASSDAS